jgi:hypothetical protein
VLVEDLIEFVNQNGGVVAKQALWNRFHHGLGDVDTLQGFIDESQGALILRKVFKKGRPLEVIFSRSFLLSSSSSSSSSENSVCVQEKAEEQKPGLPAQIEQSPARERAKVQWRL